MMKIEKDITSALINTIGLIFSIITAPRLYSRVNVPEYSEEKSLIIIYIITIMVFWLIQIAYHIMVFKDIPANKLHRIDRASMLFLIATIFSPVMIRYVSKPASIVIVVMFWVFACVGLYLLLTMKDLPRKLAPILSFSMGIIALITLLVNYKNIPSYKSVLFLIGTLFLIGAGVVYVIKKPDVKPQTFGFHEVFHTFLSIGIVILFYFVLP